MHERPVTGPGIDGLLDAVWSAGATDLLLTMGRPPQMRLHGQLCSVPGAPMLTGSETDALLAELLTEAQAASLDVRQEYDFSVTWRNMARVRGNAFSQRGFTAVTLRIIPMEIPTMDELGLPKPLREFTSMHQGLILVTGPTGSGKSTTLAAMIDQINSERACHIITIEDPIEYLHKHKRATISQREVGTDTVSFADALRASMRNDPDVVLVGEMRDLESIRFALTIAETGHLVLASLHTNDTAQALARIIDVFPADQQAQVRTQLAAALTGIVYQRLLPKIGGGLVAAHEVMVANTAIRNLIKEGKTHQLRNALVTGQREGMITFEQSLNALIRARTVSYDDAVARSLYPREVEPS
ncbi:twitching motility protein PilT [Rhizocola hellebori]|uniref:Twitching motility protein PilT n=1 Tax=Rhizocola hellebori TaxID=1392758 RepID=A0A8J3Q800_9ACTN|nr:PilT/PilU family type 4a pilus ATPase [Rhizocola hellebori]GIH05535.1 twitching motility protein PilT [Rhizocola hellebori]